MTKRASDQFMAMDDDQLELELEDMPVTDSCDVVRYATLLLNYKLPLHVALEFARKLHLHTLLLSLGIGDLIIHRRKIRTLIDNGEMKVGEFQKEINVTSKAYSMFMSQHGAHKGMGSSVYLAAWAFFKKRELKGIKTTPNKKAKKDDAASGGKDSVPSVDDVELEGEEDDEVPVYGKCLTFGNR
jgi:hypothetical protein